ncbi:MAG: ABC transporter permease subunit [Spirochaetales bacterium]|nr:ABC transporter permease subunit [Spirochaetales bacterium]
MKLLPDTFSNMFGFSGIITNLVSHIARYLYGFIFIVFPGIYVVLAAYKLVAKLVDSGSMVYLLTTPNSRVKIITTQAIFHAVMLFIIIFIQTIFGIIICASSFPGMLDIGKYINLNLITFFVLLSVGGIAFFFSCIFNRGSLAASFGAGISIGFWMIKMLAESKQSLNKLRYLTLFTFIDIEKILSKENYVLKTSFILLGISLFFYITAIIIFNKRSLSNL